MTSNKSIFILLFPLLVIASECPDDFIAIDNSCFYKKHIDVLQDFIDVNEDLRRSVESDFRVADSLKAQKILKWKPKFSFEELVGDMVESDLKLISSNL